MAIFVDIYFWVTSNGYSLWVISKTNNYSSLCFVMKSSIIHTTTVIKKRWGRYIIGIFFLILRYFF